MKRFLMVGLLAIVAMAYTGLAFAAPSQGLLDDGEFNDPDSSSDVTNSDWVLTTNSPDGVDLASRFQFSGFSRSDGAAGSGSGLWYRSFEGNQGGTGEPLAQSTLTQSIAAPADGDYVMTVDWAREGNFTAASWDVSLSSSGTGGTDTVDLLNASGNIDFNFNQLLTTFGGPNVATLTLSGVTAGDTLTVTASMVDGADSQIPGGQSAFIDNFNLRLIPEPTSVALLSIALGAIVVRRRR
ncbi:MAG: PEP-CTERM sorting domain-containing protein [Planctomycetota bacterium]